MMPKPKVLIRGHSFVCRFEAFLSRGLDSRVRQDLNLSQSAQMTFHRVGGSTVDKINVFDLHVVGRLQPDIVILEVGSHDVCIREVKAEIVGSKIETLVQHLHAHFNVKFIVVCQTMYPYPCITRTKHPFL